MKITRRPTTRHSGEQGLHGIGVPPDLFDFAARYGGGCRGPERVDVGEVTRLHQHVRDALRDPDAVRADVVAELRERVRSGRYDPSPVAVAERLLSELALDLLC